MRLLESGQNYLENIYILQKNKGMCVPWIWQMKWDFPSLL